jgi:nucleoside 2-deoxyribosyltransferase
MSDQFEWDDYGEFEWNDEYTLRTRGIIIKEDYDFYIAGPVFTEAERDYNLNLYTDLKRHGFKCYLPQLSGPATNRNIFKKNMSMLMISNAVIAICDGADVDSGTSWECGKFHGHGKIYALRTDYRKNADDPSGINLMISQSADEIFTNREKLLKYIFRTYRSRFKKTTTQWTIEQYKSL